MEKTTKRIQQICRVIALFMKICCFIFLVLFCISVVFILSRNSLHVPADQFNILLFNSAYTGIQSLIPFAVFILAYRIFRDISKEYTPFLPKNVRRMKTIAFLTIGWGILCPAAFFVLRKIIPIESAVTVNGFGRIFIGILIYCFAVIFEYACLLQQQSDETM